MTGGGVHTAPVPVHIPVHIRTITVAGGRLNVESIAQPAQPVARPAPPHAD